MKEVFVVLYSDGGHGSAVWTVKAFAKEKDAKRYCADRNSMTINHEAYDYEKMEVE